MVANLQDTGQFKYFLNGIWPIALTILYDVQKEDATGFPLDERESTLWKSPEYLLRRVNGHPFSSKRIKMLLSDLNYQNVPMIPNDSTILDGPRWSCDIVLSTVGKCSRYLLDNHLVVYCHFLSKTKGKMNNC
jgi:hypothetical protein